MTPSFDRWLSFDRVAPAPTFFARPAFAFALADAHPKVRADPIRIVHDARTYLVPVVRARGPFGFTHALAFPLGTYSCVLDEGGNAASGEIATEVLRETAHHFDRVQFVAWPLGAQPDLDGAQVAMRRTSVIDCADGFDEIMKRMKSGVRRTAGQAERRGVRARRAAPSDAEMTRYYRMLEDASRRVGLERPTISRRLLDAVAYRGGDDVELWFAEIDGEAIAGGVALFGRDELFFWTSAMRREFSTYRPSNALCVRLLERACERGVRWCNLGASEGLDGVAHFKRGLGARTIEYAVIEARSARYRAYAHLRERIVSRAPA